MGDKALRGNRLTAQGGGRIAGPARRAQEHGFYSPDMGMRGRFGYKHGGKTKTPEHYLVHGYGSTYKPKRAKKNDGGSIKGPHGFGPKPFLNKPGQAQGTHGGKIVKASDKAIKGNKLTKKA